MHPELILIFTATLCSASFSNIYSVRPNTISILFLFINGILNVARFQNCATLVDISKVQKRAVSRISLSLERTLLFQSCLQLCHSEVDPLVCLCVMCTDFAHTTTASLASYNLLPSTIASSSIQLQQLTLRGAESYSYLMLPCLQSADANTGPVSRAWSHHSAAGPRPGLSNTQDHQHYSFYF